MAYPCLEVQINWEHQLIIGAKLLILLKYNFLHFIIVMLLSEFLQIDTFCNHCNQEIKYLDKSSLCFFLNFFFYCTGWVYIVAFTKVLRIYQTCNTWITCLFLRQSSLSPWAPSCFLSLRLDFLIFLLVLYGKSKIYFVSVLFRMFLRYFSVLLFGLLVVYSILCYNYSHSIAQFVYPWLAARYFSFGLL
jgi:hypothetical protein